MVCVRENVRGERLEGATRDCNQHKVLHQREDSFKVAFNYSVKEPADEERERQIFDHANQIKTQAKENEAFELGDVLAEELLALLSELWVLLVRLKLCLFVLLGRVVGVVTTIILNSRHGLNAHHSNHGGSSSELVAHSGRLSLKLVVH